MTSRQFRRSGRKTLRRVHAMRDPRATSNAWRNAFVSLCTIALAIYALSLSLGR